MNKRDHRRGVLLMVGATACWASAGVGVRNLQLTDSWEITFWRSLFMMLFILVVLIVQYGGATWERIKAVGWPGIAVGALWALMYTCYILALGRTTVANALVLSSLAPFATAVAGSLFLHERVPARTWLAMSVAIVGIVMMFVESMQTSGASGNLIALVIPVAFACNVIIVRKTQAHVDMIPTLVWAGLISTVLTGPLAWPFQATSFDLAVLAGMGVVQLGLGCLLLLAATPKLPAAELGLLTLLETLFGTTATWIFVGEHPHRLALIGGLMVIGSLLINELIALRMKLPMKSGSRASALERG
jgi:drug/metabolite transporter (DMT)-like permease